MKNFNDLDLLTQNLTLSNLFVILLSALIVEGLRITGRDTKRTSGKTRFSVTTYVADRINVWSLVLSFLCGLLLLIVRDGFIQSMGLAVTDHQTFGLFYAVAVGTGAQGMVKILFKAAANLGTRDQRE